MQIKEYLGEFIGTFIMVLFGCSSVASAVLFNAFNSLLEVALIWGFGVTIAIFATRNFCPSHLNPAVSIAMFLSKKLALKKLPLYILSQFLGAILAGIFIYFMFNDSIVLFEKSNAIIRGTSASANSCQMFGEFYPNPGFKDKLHVSTMLACSMEALGTFILVFVIFRLTQIKEQIDSLTPILIGLTVTAIICLVAPFTQAGLNPARDFGPRVVAYIGGWGNAAFPAVNFSFFTVYILSPIIGGAFASFLEKYLVQKKNKIGF